MNADAALAAALLAPLVAALAVVAAPRWPAGAVKGWTGGGVVRLVAAASAGVWVALLVAAGVEHAGRFAATPVGAAAAAGTALLVAATKPAERSTIDTAVLVVAWAAAAVGIAAGVGDPSTLPLAVGLAAATAAISLAGATSVNRPLPTTLATAGTALVVAGFAVAGEEAAHFGADAFTGSPVGTFLALAGAAVVVTGALGGDGPIVLAGPALAVAAVVTPHAAGPPAAAVVGLGLAGLVAGWFDRRPLAIALVAVATLAFHTPAGLLLAAAAVVVAAVPSSVALLAALPGASALAAAAAQDPSAEGVAATVAAAGAGALLTVGRDLRPTTIPLRSVPAALAGAHLLVAAGRWWSGWVGADDGVLDHWDRGAATAAATAVLAVVVAALAGHVDLTARPRADADAATDAEPGLPARDPQWGARAVTAALAVLGLAAAGLVRSALRSV